jgi:spore germination cell wall hydrolase CwlJ-like protein
MFKTIRVAASAAAAAFLCIGNSAAATEAETPNQVSPASAAATATPITATPITAPVIAEAPVKVEQAVIPANFTILPTAGSADAALTPGRIRPDRPSAVAPAPVAVAEPARAPAAGTPPVLLAAPEAAAAPARVAATAGTRRNLDDLVVEHAAAEIDDEQFQCLASAVYFESRGEPLAGQLAVAEVILNRVDSGRFRATICDVVKQPSQFSFVRRGVIPQPKRETAAWQRAVAVAHIAMNNLHDVTGDDSLFFHATYVNPGWGRPARRIARIGNHIFYR